MADYLGAFIVTVRGEVRGFSARKNSSAGGGGAFLVGGGNGEEADKFNPADLGSG